LEEIVVKAPFSPIHAACQQLITMIATEVEDRTSERGFECDALGGGTGTLDICNEANDLHLKGKEAGGCVDITIGEVLPSRLPYLICEIRYPESYRELKDVASTWLMDYDKEVLAVIIVEVTKPATTENFNPANRAGFAEVWERDR
jgi:hypothetical protein